MHIYTLILTEGDSAKALAGMCMWICMHMCMCVCTYIHILIYIYIYIFSWMET